MTMTSLRGYPNCYPITKIAAFRRLGMRTNPLKKLARPERFELPTPRFVVWCSIQLSYGRQPAATSKQGRRVKAADTNGSRLPPQEGTAGNVGNT